MNFGEQSPQNQGANQSSNGRWEKNGVRGPFQGNNWDPDQPPFKMETEEERKKAEKPKRFPWRDS